jgi:hypothetical protein
MKVCSRRQHEENNSREHGKGYRWGMNEAVITRIGFLDMQVCVPKDWSDKEVIDFAERENPCGTENGWQIRKQGDKDLAGDNERVGCSDDSQKVHIMLVA